jgi:hypothetical protein
MRKEFKDIPKMDGVIKQIEGIYSTKEAIESASITDIQQFYTFMERNTNLAKLLKES